MDARLDSILQDRFRLIRMVGEGGMGIVYLACDLLLDRHVAVKILKIGSVVAAKRFERECRALAEIKSPQVPEVYSWGVTADGSPFMVMEFVEGVSLEHVILGESLTWTQSRDIFVQVCDGLTAIHQAGMVHRDIKPANVVLTKTEGQTTAKLMDLGIVHLLDQDMRLTGTNDFVGTSGYLSPEHLTPQLLDARSDIFSLGCLMYWVVTGVLPFNTGSLLNDLLLIRSNQFKMPDSDNPAFLKFAICKCLAAKPEDRFQSASELKKVLLEETTVTQQLKAFVTKEPAKPFLSVRAGLLSCTVLFGVVCLVLGLNLSQVKSNRDYTSIRDSEELLAQLRSAISDKDFSRVEVLSRKLKSLPDYLLGGLPGKRDAFNRLELFISFADAAGQTSSSAAAFEAAKVIASKLGNSNAATGELLVLQLRGEVFRKDADLKVCRERALQLLQMYKDDRKLSKQVLSIMASVESMDGRAVSEVYYLKDLVAGPLVDDPGTLQLIVGAALNLSSRFPDERARYLCTVVSALEELLKQKSLSRDLLINSLLAIRKIPSSERTGTLASNQLLRLIDNAAGQGTKATKQGACSDILRTLFYYDTKAKEGKTLLLKQLDQCNPNSSDQQICDVVCAVNQEFSIPAKQLWRLVKEQPEYWMADSRIKKILDQYETRSEIEYLRCLFEKANWTPGSLSDLKMLAGVRLASVLNSSKSYTKADETLDALKASSNYFKDECIERVVSIYLQRGDVDALSKLVHQVQSNKVQLSAAAEVRVLLGLAEALIEKGKVKDSDEVLDEITQLEWFRPELRTSVNRVYHKRADLQALRRLKQAARRAMPLAPLERARLLACFASLFDDCGDSETAYSIVRELERTAYFFNEGVWNTVYAVYSRHRDYASLYRAVGRAKDNPGISTDLRALLVLHTAFLLSEFHKFAESREVMQKLPDGFAYTDEITDLLCSIYWRQMDVDGLQALYRRAWRNCSFSFNHRFDVAIRYAALLSSLNRKNEADIVIQRLKQYQQWCSPRVVGQLINLYEDKSDIRSLQRLASELAHEPRSSLSVREFAELKALGAETVKRDRKTYLRLERLRLSAISRKDEQALLTLEGICLRERDIEGLRKIFAAYRADDASFTPEFRLEAESRYALLLAQLDREDEAYSTAVCVEQNPRFIFNELAVRNLIDCYSTQLSVPNLRRLLEKLEKGRRTRSAVYAGACLADVQSSLGDESDADTVSESIKRTPEWFFDNGVADRLANIYLRRGSDGELIELIDTLAAKCPEQQFNARIRLAQLRLQCGKVEDALVVLGVLQKQLLLRWTDSEAGRLADLYERAASIPELEELYRLAQAHSSRLSSQIGLRLARCLNASGKVGDANSRLNEVLQKEPRPLRPQILQILSSIYLEQCSIADLRRVQLEMERRCPDSTTLGCEISLLEVLCKKGIDSEARKIIAELTKNSAIVAYPSMLSRLSAVLEQRRDLSGLRSLLAKTGPFPSRYRTLYVTCNLRLANLLSADKQEGAATKLMSPLVQEVFRTKNAEALQPLGEIYFRRMDSGNLEKVFLSLPRFTIKDECLRSKCGLNLALLLSRTEPTRAEKLLNGLTRDLSYRTCHGSIRQELEKIRKLANQLVSPTSSSGKPGQ